VVGMEVEMWCESRNLSVVLRLRVLRGVSMMVSREGKRLNHITLLGGCQEGFCGRYESNVWCVMKKWEM
jgi:hypothetical protein